MHSTRVVALAVLLVVGGCGDDATVVRDAGIDGPADVVSQTIGPSGGSVVVPGFTLVIPAGALSSEQVIEISWNNEPAPPGFVAESPMYHLEPAGLEFALPVIATVHLPSIAPRTRVVWSKRGDAGFDDLGGTIEGNDVTATNTHFSDVFAGLLPVELVITPTTADFGTVFLGEDSPDITFTVENFGKNETDVLVNVISGPQSAHFSITANNCITLGSGESCPVLVHCVPTTTGAKSAALLVGDLTYMASATLECAAVAHESITVSPSSRDFGNVMVGVTSPKTTFYVTNPSGIPRGPLDTSLAGTNSGDFTIATDQCDGTTLAPGASCNVNIAFAPMTTGARSGVLQVSGPTTVTASLTGTGVTPPPQLRVTPAMLHFGGVLVGTSASHSFTVENIGGSATGALSLARTGSTTFTLESNNCANTSLAAAATCTFVVRFTPTSGGSVTRTATIDIAGAFGGSAAVTFFGTENTNEGILISPGLRSFGTVNVGASSGWQTFTVINAGGLPTGFLTVSRQGAHPDDFEVDNDQCTGASLAAGQFCTFDARFTPTVAGTRTAHVQAVAIPGGIAVAGVDGSGSAPVALGVSPSTHDFGSGRSWSRPLSAASASSAPALPASRASRR
ncbi:MAG: choice-of-anchor D domain-containing protein [Kofleriaceae bacterium]